MGLSIHRIEPRKSVFALQELHPESFVTQSQQIWEFKRSQGGDERGDNDRDDEPNPHGTLIAI
jgi:hypothetical protein